MKKVLSFIVILCLICTLFVGCGEGSESPTNAPVSQGESVVQNSETKESETASSISGQEQEPSVSVVSQEEPVQTASSKPSVSLVSSAPSETSGKPIPSQPVSSEATSVTTPSSNEIHGDEAWSEPPGFTSTEGFHSWLQIGGIEEEKRGELLSNTKGSPTYSDTTYLRPKLGNGNNSFALSTIEAYPYAVIYRYGFVKNPDIVGLKITIYVDSAYMDTIKNDMQKCYDLINSPEERKYDKYGSATVNQITYYYYHYPANDSTTVYWKIGENTFKVKYYGDYSQINDILPLLELEQAGYTISDNTVIK